MKPIPNDALFHCGPLNAPTMRVGQCRENRARREIYDGGRGRDAGKKLRFKPIPCRGCALAVELEAGRVETWTLAQAEAALLSGERRAAP